MLHELRVENLLLIERAELRLGVGLNVLTGETGAGKTVLAHALDLLLGGRPRGRIVRPGAPEAYVEGVFALSDELRARWGERLPADAEELVLARRVSAEGRTRAYVGGRSATAGDLQEIGAGLLSFYGQHEHRRLVLASSQLEILDGFAGAEQLRRRREFAAVHASERALRSQLEALRERAGAREREIDLLAWELQEIQDAAPSEAEEIGLVSERERLRHLEGLQTAAATGLAALAPDAGSEGAVAGLATATRALDGVGGIDPALDALAGRLRGLEAEAQDLAAELRDYGEALLASAGEPDDGSSAGDWNSPVAARLDQVEERLSRLERLKRKHGGTIAGVIEHAEACRRRREELDGAAEALTGVHARLEALRIDIGRRAGELRAARQAAADRLGEVVRERLGRLAMEGASFEVALSDRADHGPSGADEVEFLVAPNPGVPADPLRETASGGELSRVMLALLSVAAEGRPATLVFDEVDAGIGGQTARAVGEHLRSLAAARQVICITHLPQIASLADRHFTIVKDSSVDPARTNVSALDGQAVVDELMRMLGAGQEDSAARRHAQELLKAA